MVLQRVEGTWRSHYLRHGQWHRLLETMSRAIIYCYFNHTWPCLFAGGQIVSVQRRERERQRERGRGLSDNALPTILHNKSSNAWTYYAEKDSAEGVMQLLMWPWRLHYKLAGYTLHTILQQTLCTARLGIESNGAFGAQAVTESQGRANQF